MSALRRPPYCCCEVPEPKPVPVRGGWRGGSSSSSPSIFFLMLVMKLLTLDCVSRNPFRMFSRMTGRSSMGTDQLWPQLRLDLPYRQESCVPDHHHKAHWASDPSPSLGALRGVLLAALSSYPLEEERYMQVHHCNVPPVDARTARQLPAGLVLLLVSGSVWVLVAVEEAPLLQVLVESLDRTFLTSISDGVEYEVCAGCTHPEVHGRPVLAVRHWRSIPLSPQQHRWWEKPLSAYFQPVDVGLKGEGVVEGQLLRQRLPEALEGC